MILPFKNVRPNTLTSCFPSSSGINVWLIIFTVDNKNNKLDNNIHIKDKIFPIFSSPIRLNGKAIGSITIERMNHYKFENSESLKLEKLSIALGKAFEWSNDFKLIENAAIHDGLTSLLNHNAFLNRLDQEIDRCSRFQTSLGLIMLDLDKFKKINDTYGHLYGDYILKEVGKIIKENVGIFGRNNYPPRNFG